MITVSVPMLFYDEDCKMLYVAAKVCPHCISCIYCVIIVFVLILVYCCGICNHNYHYCVSIVHCVLRMYSV